MSIFTLYERLCRTRVTGSILLTALIIEVHRAGDVCALAAFCPFIMNRTRLVHVLHHIISLEEILTMTGLVSKTPNDD